MKRRWLPDWVTSFKDRHGKTRYRFRRKGFRQHCFVHAPGTPEFMAEYQSCLDGIAAEPVRPGADRFTPGSFDDLISRWYVSGEFEKIRDRTKTVYRNDIERWRRRYGSAMVCDLSPKHVVAMMAERLPHKTSANNLRKRLGQLMQFAISIELATSNPVRAVKPYEIEGDGHHSWTDDEIAQYEARHPLGTQARLMFDLLLWTGQRRGDVRTLGPVHVKGNRLEFYQEKRKGKKALSIPIMAPLAESILATPTGKFTFLVTRSGTAYGRDSIGNLFAGWCAEAGLTNCSAHGLRKAAARRLAEAGCTNQEIKSWTGHDTDAEVSRYTKAASDKTLSDAAAVRLMANLAERLANNADKSLKTKG